VCFEREGEEVYNAREKFVQKQVDENKKIKNKKMREKMHTAA